MVAPWATQCIAISKNLYCTAVVNVVVHVHHAGRVHHVTHRHGASTVHSCAGEYPICEHYHPGSVLLTQKQFEIPQIITWLYCEVQQFLSQQGSMASNVALWYPKLTHLRTATVIAHLAYYISEGTTCPHQRNLLHWCRCRHRLQCWSTQWAAGIGCCHSTASRHPGSLRPIDGAPRAKGIVPISPDIDISEIDCIGAVGLVAHLTSMPHSPVGAPHEKVMNPANLRSKIAKSEIFHGWSAFMEALLSRATMHDASQCVTLLRYTDAHVAMNPHTR